MLIKKQILNFHINYNNFYSKISTVLNHICVTDQNTQILIASGTFLIYFIFKESINYLLEIFRLISLQACANTGNQWDLTKNTRKKKQKTKNQKQNTHFINGCFVFKYYSVAFNSVFNYSYVKPYIDVFHATISSQLNEALT